jgi:ferredoxin
VYRIEIDDSLCSGYGLCAELAPRSLRLGDDGLAEATRRVTDDVAVLEAAACCPMSAIVILDEAEADAA